jgi:alkylated DNA repair dioxygenase AlkB
MTAPPLDVRYFADALPDADTDLAFLLTEVAWDDRMRARRTAGFGVPYNYSDQHYDPAEMPPRIAAIAARAAGYAGHPFNNCLANRYDTGDNTMGFHQDSYEGLAPDSAIAIVSLGATRPLVFRSIDRSHRIELALEHGSLLLMTYTTQRAWTHGLPRAASTGRRVSLTFRCFRIRRGKAGRGDWWRVAPDGYLLGSYRITTVPEPNSSRLTSFRSTCFDSPANNVGPWPASLGCTTNSYSSINPSSVSASGSCRPATSTPLTHSRLSRWTASARSPRTSSAFQSTRSRVLDTTYFFAASIVRAKGSIHSGLAPAGVGGRHASSIIS